MKALAKIGLITFLLFAPTLLSAQDTVKQYLLDAVVIGDDTLPNIKIKEVRVFSRKVFKSNRQKRQFTRLVYNVKKAYPFSIVARNELSIMNDQLKNIQGNRAREKYIKEYQKQMFVRYEDDLRKLTITQGRILLKLVDREIGNTSYDLVKEYRGSFSAAFWQGIARLFGSNMKSEYDPKGEDAEIEEIVLLIEDGLI
jgi:hypothetical protein